MLIKGALTAHVVTTWLNKKVGTINRYELPQTLTIIMILCQLWYAISFFIIVYTSCKLITRRVIPNYLGSVILQRNWIFPQWVRSSSYLPAMLLFLVYSLMFRITINKHNCIVKNTWIRLANPVYWCLCKKHLLLRDACYPGLGLSWLAVDWRSI